MPKSNWLPLCLVLVASASCARKAPGPSECRALALRSIGLPPTTSAERLAVRPDLYEQAEVATQRCLTLPYDYELLRCLQLSNAAVCGRSFERRRLGPLPGQPE